jgi:hypothetical protein
MKVIIQCAGSKHSDAGTLKTAAGEELIFVATPDLCELDSSRARHVRPDDVCLNSANTLTWRDVLRAYNDSGSNPYGLYQAGDLYKPSIYQELVAAFGRKEVFVLSAGWGLLRADFWTPDYDITFSKDCRKKKPWAWRNIKAATERMKDFNHLRDARIAEDETIHYFGGNDYLPLLYALITDLPARKIVHHKKESVERVSGFEYTRFHGKKNQNWHYQAASEFIMNPGHE